VCVCVCVWVGAWVLALVLERQGKGSEPRIVRYALHRCA
jgi:hypothetical protein